MKLHRKEEMQVERAGQALGNWLGSHLDWSERDREIASFSFALIFSTTFFFATLVTMASLAGVLREAMVLALSAGTLKAFAGGAHFSTGWRCGIVSSLLVTAAAWAVRTFGPGLQEALGAGASALALLVALGVAAAMWRHAPVDVPEKPITSEAQRTRLRRISIALPLLWGGATASLLLTESAGGASGVNGALWMASAVGLLWETFSVVPSGAGAVRWLDRQIGRVVVRA